MIEQKDLAGSFTLLGKSMTLNRMGYGAMQLAGPGVWGPPRDVNTAIAVLLVVPLPLLALRSPVERSISVRMPIRSAG